MKKVICIDSNGTSELNVGQIYEVVSDLGYGGPDGDYELKGISASYMKKRFRDLDTDATIAKRFVKCIDAVGGSAGTYLEMNKVYELLRESYDSYFIGTRADGWRKDRFVFVTKSVPIDASDWRVWRDSSILPGHCVCQIPKSLCSYHKA